MTTANIQYSAARLTARVVAIAIHVCCWLFILVHVDTSFAATTFFQQNVVSNGTFDANAGSWIGGNIAAQGGWTATGGNPGGNFILDSTGDPSTDPSLCQGLTGLTTGRVFEISGDYASFAEGSGDPQKGDAFMASIDGAAVLELPRPDPATTWTPFVRQFVATSANATLCFVAERNGDDSSFRIDNVSMVRTQLIIVVTPSTPVAGQPLELEATLPSGLPVDRMEVFYRMSGEATYSSATFTIGSTVGNVSIPAVAITLRGVEYYLAITSGQGVTTIPQTNPQVNPIRLRIGFGEVAGPALQADGRYQMVSVPAHLNDGAPLAVLADDLGPYEGLWRLLRWEGQSYAEVPDIGGSFEPGIAFWLASRGERTFDIEDAISVDASQPFDIRLQPGWNQIATPFNFPVLWNDVVGSAQVQEPVGFDGIEYVYNQAALDPWSGYFVFNPDVDSVTISVPPTSQSASAKRAKSPNVSGVFEFQIVGTVENSDLRDTQNFVGFTAGSEDSQPRVDVVEAPGIGEHLRVSVMDDRDKSGEAQRVSNQFRTRLAKSVQPLTQEGHAWDVEVELVSPDDLIGLERTVVIRIEEVAAAFNRSDGRALSFAVMHGGRLVAEAPGEEIRLRMSPTGRREILTVIIGSLDYVESSTANRMVEPAYGTLSAPFPNPFVSQTRVSYRIHEAQHVKLTIFDVLGRTVRVLDNEDKQAGTHESPWDGRADDGVSVGAGVYFLRLQTATTRSIRKVVRGQ